MKTNETKRAQLAGNIAQGLINAILTCPNRPHCWSCKQLAEHSIEMLKSLGLHRVAGSISPGRAR